MAKVKVKLLKPLDGREIGSTTYFSEADVKRLEQRNAVERVKVKTAAKAKPKPKNKMAAAPENKDAGGSADKDVQSPSAQSSEPPAGGQAASGASDA